MAAVTVVAWPPGRNAAPPPSRPAAGQAGGPLPDGGLRPPGHRRAKAHRAAASAHRREIAGVVLVLVAGVGALGIWLGVAGAAGDALAFLGGSAVGLGVVVLPVVAAVFGVALLRHREGELGRLAAGGGLAATGFAGLLYLVRPSSKVGQGLDGWRRAGGVLGAAVGHPLRSLAGPWGAGLILAALAFVGSLILFRLSSTRCGGV